MRRLAPRSRFARSVHGHARCCSPDASDICRWNDHARAIVAERRLSPPVASRLYAYLHVAIDDAVREAPDELDAIARAILAALLGDAAAAPEPESCSARAIIERLQQRMRTDRASAVWQGTVPVGPGFWRGDKPLLPLWGEVEPWCVEDVKALRPEPPPAFGSPCFARALAEVRQISDHRTGEQLRIARFWADGVGTSTPPGHWNEIACEILLRSTPDAREAARILRCLNVAMADAAICCWDAKYAYWLLRPSQADPEITTPVGLPPFPSYTSGHSTFSAAAATVLGALIPSSQAEVEAMAEEAAVSRLYAAIHYPFDNEVGLDAGHRIGELALACCSQRDGSRKDFRLALRRCAARSLDTS